jgi:hypothetical protein
MKPVVSGLFPVAASEIPAKCLPGGRYSRFRQARPSACAYCRRTWPPLSLFRTPHVVGPAQLYLRIEWGNVPFCAHVAGPRRVCGAVLNV